MAKISRRYDAERWTGDGDRATAIALVIALLIGAVGFLVSGAATLH